MQGFQTYSEIVVFADDEISFRGNALRNVCADSILSININIYLYKDVEQNQLTF